MPIRPGQSAWTRAENEGCGFFAYNWKLPAYSGAFLLTVDISSFFTYSWSFFAYNFSFFSYSSSFFAYSGKVHLYQGLQGLKAKKLNCKHKSSKHPNKNKLIGLFRLTVVGCFTSFSSGPFSTFFCCFQGQGVRHWRLSRWPKHDENYEKQQVQG